MSFFFLYDRDKKIDLPRKKNEQATMEENRRINYLDLHSRQLLSPVLINFRSMLVGKNVSTFSMLILN